jgi:hypothetical protein
VRIRSLALRPFGSHEHTELTFEKPGVLSVVYGANEAGKSTTRRAIVSLLYGIDERSPDGHRFHNKNLRIAASIESDGSAPLSVVRRKGRKDTLTFDDGDAANAPVPDAAWAKLLAGVTRDAYERAYGLDHELLRRGAEALLAGDVDLGESLFQASAGTVNLGRFRASLVARADAIYSDRARTKPLSVSMAQWTEHRKTVRDFAMSSETYQQQKDSLNEAEAERVQLEASRDELTRERAVKEHAVALGRLFVKQKSLLDALVKLGPDARALGDGAAAVDADDYQRRRGEASSQRSEIEKLTAERAAADERAIAIEARLGAAPPDLTQLELTDLEVTLPKLAREPALLADRIAHERLQLTRFSHDLSALATTVDARDVALDVAGLRAALADAEPVLARTARLPELVAERARVDADARDAGAVAADAKVPSPGALEPFERESAALSAALLAIESEAARHRERGVRVDTDLGALTAEFAPPSDEELASARAERDALLSDAMKDPKKLDAVANAVRGADALADRMRRESKRVAERARLVAEKAALARAATEAAAGAEELAARRRALNERFAALFAGVSTPSIEGGRALVESVLRARTFASNARDLENRIADLEAEASRARASLARHVGNEDAGLAGLVALARETLAEVNAAAALQRARDDQRKSIERSRAESEQTLAEAERKLAAAQAALAGAHEALGLSTDARDEIAVRRLDDLRELFRARGTRSASAARIEALASQVRDLDALTVRLHRELGLAQEMEGDDAERRAVAVGRRLRELADAEKERKALQRQLGEVELSIGGHGGDPATPIDPREVADADARLSVLAAELETIDQALPRLLVRIGGERKGMASLEQHETRALEASLEAEQKLAEIAELAARYSRLTIAQMILDERIEAHRAESEHEVLARASALVAKMTLGSVTGLRASYDDVDRPALVAVRPDGSETPMSGLSDGSKDQLYLALRVASLERVARSGAALPVLLDDVLVHFDDERAKAALLVVADLAKATQVIFFTHHKRIVELATEALPASDVAFAMLGAG